MNRMNVLTILSGALLIFSTVCSAQDDFPCLKGPYLGQTAPADKAEVFLDGVISTLDNAEMCAAFTFDGKEFYYNALYKNCWAIFQTREVNGKWTEPQPMPFTAGFTDRDFTMSPDGQRIFFGSDRPRRSGEEPLSAPDIYVTNRISDGSWSEPENLGTVINTDRTENYPSTALSGNLYFFSCSAESLGGCDIYVSRQIDGQYLPPEKLGDAVNSEKHDWDAFIAPDESYIIFSSQNRDDTLGKQDLYISFLKSDGNWTKARNMGASVNSESDEICPSVSLDGQHLFFTSRRRGKNDIFWIKAEILRELKKHNESL